MTGRSWRSALASVGLALCLPALLLAQNAGPQAYRRIFVPQDDLEAQIRGLLPLKRDEFERRLLLAGAVRDASQRPAEVRVEAAVFRARHDGGRLSGGTAELEIVLPSERAAVLTLAPCSFAIESAYWKGDPKRPAVLGADAIGAICCLVERSGTLLLEWTQRGEQRSFGGAAWNLQFPVAPRCKLEIETAGDEQLDSQAGLSTVGDPADRNAGRREWTIELGGRSQTRIKIEPSAKGPDR